MNHASTLLVSAAALAVFALSTNAPANACGAVARNPGKANPAAALRHCDVPERLLAQIRLRREHLSNNPWDR